MITYDKSGKTPVVAGALVLVVGLVAGAWFWRSEQAVEAPAAASGATSVGPGIWFRADSSDDVHHVLNPDVASDGRPSDVDQGDWGSLNGALSKAGVDAKEAGRIVGFLRFQHSFEAWQNMDETRDADRRRRIAEALLAEVPDRLKSGDFTPIEANLMGAVLIAGLAGSEEVRAKKLEDWQAQLNQISPMPEDEKAFTALSKKTEFSRRLASAYDDWQKTPQGDSNRTPAKLEQAVADIRRQANSGEL
jgi:hypothetical protein